MMTQSEALVEVERRWGRGWGYCAYEMGTLAAVLYGGAVCEVGRHEVMGPRAYVKYALGRGPTWEEALEDADCTTVVGMVDEVQQ